MEDDFNDLLGPTYWDTLKFFQWLVTMRLYETADIIFKHNKMISRHYLNEVTKTYIR